MMSMMEEFSETIIKLLHIHTIKPRFSGPGFHFTQELGTVLYTRGTGSRDKWAKVASLCY